MSTVASPASLRCPACLAPANWTRAARAYAEHAPALSLNFGDRAPCPGPGAPAESPYRTRARDYRLYLRTGVLQAILLTISSAQRMLRASCRLCCPPQSMITTGLLTGSTSLKSPQASFVNTLERSW